MADRSFEEQVREEMDGLLIRPGVAVWEQLEADLTRKKKRRGLVWFFFAGLGILLLLAVGYGLWERQVQVHESPAAVVTGKDSASPQLGATAILPDSNDQVAARQEKKRVPHAFIYDKTAVTVTAERSTAAFKAVEKPTAGTQAIPEVHNDLTRNGRSLSVEKEAAAKPDSIAADAPLPVHNIDQMDSLRVPLLPTAFTADTLPNASPLLTKEKMTASKRWQLSLAVTVGSSGMRKLPGQTLVYQSSISNPSAGGLPGGNNTYKVPSLRDAGSYGITLLADKKLSKRYGVGIALGYEAYHTKTSVGKRVDSILSSSTFTSVADQGFYYISTDSIPYVNRFHFAQAMVSGYALYTLGRSLPLRWELGLGLSALLGSNALHYDNARGVLFTNRSLLRSLQWNLSTGFEFGLGKQPFLFLGPQLTWFIQSPYTDQGSADQHLFRSALRARMVLGKKRK